MVELNHKIFIWGMICLTLMYFACLIAGKDETLIMMLVSSLVSFGVGFVIPSPKNNTKKGTLII